MKLSQYSGAQFRPWDTVLNKTQLCAPALQFPFSSSLGPLVYRARARTDLVQMLSRRSLHQKTDQVQMLSRRSLHQKTAQVQMLSRRSLHQKTAQVQMLSRRSLHQKTAQVQMLSRRSLPETTSPLQTTSSRFTFGSISLDIAPAIRKTPWRFRAQRCRRNSSSRTRSRTRPSLRATPSPSAVTGADLITTRKSIFHRCDSPELTSSQSAKCNRRAFKSALKFTQRFRMSCSSSCASSVAVTTLISTRSR